MSSNNVNENYNWMAYASSEPAFLIRALHEYTVDCVDTQSRLLASVQEAVSYEWDPNDVLSEVQRLLSTKWNIPLSAPVLIENRYVPYGDILYRVLSSMQSLENTGLFDPDVDQVYPTLAAGGEYISSLAASFRTIMDNLKSNLHSIVAFEALLRARSSEIGDKIVVYTDAIGEYFSNVSSDISNTSNYFKNFLTQNLNDGDFISNVLTAVGVQEVLNTDDADEVDLSVCDVSKYTGASPMSAITTKGAIDTISNSVKTCVSVVGSVFRFIGRSISSIFSKVGKKIKEVAIDPNDLTILDEDAPPFIDGFYIADAITASTTIDGVPYFEMASNLASDGDQSAALTSLTRKWISQDFIYGSVRIFLAGPIVSRVSDNNPNLIQYYVPVEDSKILFKPRILNHYSVRKAFLASGATVVTDGYGNTALGCTNLRALFQNLSTMRQSIQDVSGLGERDLAKGLLSSILLYNQLPVCYQYYDAYSEEDSYLRVHFPVGGTDESGWLLPSTVTNADFVRMASGYPALVPTSEGEAIRSIIAEYLIESLSYVQMYSESNLANWEALSDNPSYRLIWQVMDSKISRTINPLTAYFFPYCTKAVAWPSSCFAIKTDDQNINAFNSFLESVIVVTFVAIVAVTAIITVKKIAANTFAKRAKKLNALNEKLQSGGKLSSGDKLQMYKLSKKLSASTIATAGMTSNTLDLSLSSSSDVDMVLKLIQGA